MNSYEALYIVKPDLEEEARTALIARFADIIAQNGGEVENTDEWGMKKLAYPIDYITDGYYVLVGFKSESQLPAELERNFKNNENIMRFMVTRKNA